METASKNLFQISLGYYQINNYVKKDLLAWVFLFVKIAINKIKINFTIDFNNIK